jgi:hypothetical protein
MIVAQEDLRAVLVVIPYDDEDEAVRLANDLDLRFSQFEPDEEQGAGCQRRSTHPDRSVRHQLVPARSDFCSWVASTIPEGQAVRPSSK